VAGGPIIGITTNAAQDVDAAQGREWDSGHATSYAEAVAAAGGVPMMLPPPRDIETDAAAAAGNALAAIQGVLLTGGGDLDPALYGQEPHPATRPPDHQRDHFELALARAAIARGAPVLGICRGIQVLVVALGGDLVQDIAGHSRDDAKDRPVHPVRLQPGSGLAALYGSDGIEVNSTHHQAAGCLAGGLAVVGRAADGIVEGVELPSAAWVIGVQWHPERLWKSYSEHRVLFDAFVGAAAEVAQGRRERTKHAV
jgi:putative glutamine amidotransferase